MGQANSIFGGWVRRARGVAAGLLLYLLSFCIPAKSEGMPPILQLSPVGASAGAPRIAASPDRDCTVVWQQSDATSPTLAVVARQRRAGQWGPLQRIGGDIPGFEAREPVLRLDTSNQPHVLWINSNGQQHFLEYAFLMESTWVRYGLIGAVSAQKIEHPVMLLGPHNTFFAAWQERLGVDYQIHAFVIDALGNTHHSILEGADQFKYVIYPELVELPAAVPGQSARIAVVWFSLEGPRAQLEMRQWNEAEKEWKPITAPRWTEKSLEYLPLVAGSAQSGLFLLGYQPAGRYDRIFLSTQATPIAYLDQNSPVQNRLPRIGGSLNGVFGLAWQQETAAGTILVHGALQPSGEIQTLPLAKANPLVPAQPDTSLTSNSLVSVWLNLVPGSNELAGENPVSYTAVFFTEREIEALAWRKATPPPADAPR